MVLKKLMYVALNFKLHLNMGYLSLRQFRILARFAFNW